MLTLKEAVKTGRLQDFIKQEEVRGVKPVDKTELDAELAKLIKQPRSKGRTLRSPSRGGLSER